MIIFLGFCFLALTLHLTDVKFDGDSTAWNIAYAAGLWLMDIAILATMVGLWMMENGKL